MPSEAERLLPDSLSPETTGLHCNIGALEIGPVEALNRDVEPATLLAVARTTRCLPVSSEFSLLVEEVAPITAAQPVPSMVVAASRLLSQRNHW